MHYCSHAVFFCTVEITQISRIFFLNFRSNYYRWNGHGDAVSLHRVNSSVWSRRSNLTFRHAFCAYDTIINYNGLGRGFQRVSRTIVYHYYSVQRPIDRARPNSRFIFKRQRSPMPGGIRSSISLYNIQYIYIYIYIGRCVHLDLSPQFIVPDPII